MTYKTTNEFLKMFGYSSLKDLPELPKYKLDSNKQIIIDEILPEDQENAPEIKQEEETRNLED